MPRQRVLSQMIEAICTACDFVCESAALRHRRARAAERRRTRRSKFGARASPLSLLPALSVIIWLECEMNVAVFGLIGGAWVVPQPATTLQWCPSAPSPFRMRSAPVKMGVKIETLIAAEPGASKPKSGDIVVAHYTGWLKNQLGGKGEQFDTSRGGFGPFQKPPFKFALGRNRVIKAWDVGVAKMKIGETARLICTSDVCYGKDGAGPIPPNADLIFEVKRRTHLFSRLGGTTHAEHAATDPLALSAVMCQSCRRLS